MNNVLCLRTNSSPSSVLQGLNTLNLFLLEGHSNCALVNNGNQTEWSPILIFMSY